MNKKRKMLRAFAKALRAHLDAVVVEAEFPMPARIRSALVEAKSQAGVGKLPLMFVYNPDNDSADGYCILRLEDFVTLTADGMRADPMWGPRMKEAEAEQMAELQNGDGNAAG